MRTVLRLSFILILFLPAIKLSAQDTTHAGTEFWVGYGHHQYMEAGQSNSQDMTIYIATGTLPAVVTVTIDSSSATPTIPGTWWSRTYNIPANTVIDISTAVAASFTTSAGSTGPIPKSGLQDARLFTDPPPAGPASEGLFRNKGIRITSNTPVMAYAHIYASVSSGATMLVPLNAWGGHYVSANSEQVDAGGPASSWMYVVAAYDNTVVEITPSVTTKLGKPAGVPFTINLNKGHIYQLMGTSDASGNGNNFTGTKVRSLVSGVTGLVHPVAVFSGSSRTRGESAPCGTTSGRDNDIQQHFPRQAWGKRYLLAPASTSGGAGGAAVFMTHVYKVIVTDPATVVSRNGVPLTGLIAAGNYYKFSSNTADLIESDQPVMVAQFMSGSSACNPGSLGDPDMVYLSPISQGIKQTRFFRNTKTAISINYVTLIIPTVGLSTLTIDGSATFDHTYAHPQLAGYTVVIKQWAAAQAQVSVQSDTTFTGITYGLGGAESYMYNIGAHIKVLNGQDASVIPLPLSLLGFTARKNNDDVMLYWSTAKETGFSHFEVERSLDAMEFTRFAVVPSLQSVDGSYETPDVNAVSQFGAHPAIYYRLKMTDRDGKFKYSGIVAIRNGKNNFLQAQVAPNPFIDKLQLQLQSETAGLVKISVRDVSGKLLETRSAKVVQGSSLIEIGPLGHLQKGIYIVELEMNGVKQHIKAVK